MDTRWAAHEPLNGHRAKCPSSTVPFLDTHLAGGTQRCEHPRHLRRVGPPPALRKKVSTPTSRATFVPLRPEMKGHFGVVSGTRTKVRTPRDLHKCWSRLPTNIDDHRFAKVRVAGSNPVFRSKYNRRSGTLSRVPVAFPVGCLPIISAFRATFVPHRKRPGATSGFDRTNQVRVRET